MPKFANQKKIIMILGLALVVIFFFFYQANIKNQDSGSKPAPSSNESKQKMDRMPTSLINEEVKRNEKGCNLDGGYFWNGKLEVCVNGEYQDNQENQIAIKAAKNYLQDTSGLNVESVVKRNCEGCFFVTVEYEGKRILVDVFSNEGRSARPIF